MYYPLYSIKICHIEICINKHQILNSILMENVHFFFPPRRTDIFQMQTRRKSCRSNLDTQSEQMMYSKLKISILTSYLLDHSIIYKLYTHSLYTYICVYIYAYVDTYTYIYIYICVYIIYVCVYYF